MKTNQMMSVDLDGFYLNIEHKTGMGDLGALWEYGNTLRVANGKKPLDLDNYLRRPETCEYMLEIEQHSNSVPGTELKIKYSERGNTAKIIGGKLTCLKTKRGRYGGTYADLYLLLDAAATLSPKFKYQVYKTFIEGKILQYRDQSGDEYKALCRAMDENGLITDQWDYARVAKAITFTVLGTIEKEQWNHATEQQLQQRKDMEGFLAQAITAGFIDSLAMVFSTIQKRRTRSLKGL